MPTFVNVPVWVITFVDVPVAPSGGVHAPGEKQPDSSKSTALSNVVAIVDATTAKPLGLLGAKPDP